MQNEELRSFFTYQDCSKILEQIENEAIMRLSDMGNKHGSEAGE
jgi:hypothetical protein